MPFTFAHPVVILPFKFLPRKWYSWTGLIIGSMVPDFEAFIKLGGGKQLSHSWFGALVFDLPLGVALAFLFHLFIRDSLLEQLPDFLFRRFYFLKNADWVRSFRKRYGIIILSVIIGIVSHLLLDRFTHTDTYTYHQKAGINLSPHRETVVRQWLQWGGSVIGVLILFWQIMAVPACKKVKKNPFPAFWPVTGAVALVVFVIRRAFPLEGDDRINTWIGGVLLGIVVASVCERIWKSKHYERKT